MSIAKAHPTIKDLQRMGYPIVSGSEYIPKAWIPKRPVSIKRIRQILSKIKGSLAETVCQIRNEE